jgi:DNA-binding CsgD family transcriptional regulator
MIKLTGQFHQSSYWQHTGHLVNSAVSNHTHMMTLTDIWNVLRAHVQQVVDSHSINNEDFQRELGLIASSWGCMMVVHCLSDPLPLYMSPSVDAVIDNASKGLTAAGLLQFVGRQPSALVAEWGRLKTQSESMRQQPYTTAVMLYDSKGQEQWLCGCYGLLSPDAQGRKLTIAIFFSMEHLTPMDIIDTNGRATREEMRARLSTLSPREMEVLQLMLQEISVSEIANRLHRSVNTIHSHRKNILNKLEAHKRFSLLLYLPLVNGMNTALRGKDY